MEQTKELTPFDYETFEMIQHLTGYYPLIEVDKNKDSFTIVVDYSDRPEPDFVDGLINAIRGRLGNRLQEVSDHADLEKFFVSCAYEKQDLPRVVGLPIGEQGTPQPAFGKTYCRKLEEVQAVQVERTKANELIMFCGGGQLLIEKKISGKCTFSFLNNGVFVDVVEHDYIVKRTDKEHFEIWGKTQFEKEFEPK